MHVSIGVYTEGGGVQPRHFGHVLSENSGREGKHSVREERERERERGGGTKKGKLKMLAEISGMGE